MIGLTTGSAGPSSFKIRENSGTPLDDRRAAPEIGKKRRCNEWRPAVVSGRVVAAERLGSGFRVSRDPDDSVEEICYLAQCLTG